MLSSTSPLPLLHAPSSCHGGRGGKYLDEEIKEGRLVVELGMKKVEERVHVVDTDEMIMRKTTSVGGGGPERVRVENRLTEREMDSLTAISDTLLPSIDVPPEAFAGGRDAESLRSLFGTSASMLGVPEVMGGYLSGGLRHALLWLLRLALWFLSTWYGTFVLCGTSSLSNRFPFFQKFSAVDLHRRQQIVRSWSISSIILLRQLYRGTKYLITLSYFTQLNEKRDNPTWKALGYCGPDPEFASQLKKMTPENNKDDDCSLGPLHRGLVYMDGPRHVLEGALCRAGLSLFTRRVPGYEKPMLSIKCDVVVVGSGSGGGVVAGMLAKEGYKVVVLEKGGYYARAGLNLLEGPSLDRMYEGGGLIATEDMGVNILAGATVGGGSAINWAAALRTPENVVREWREELDLTLFGSDAYSEALEAVSTRMNVQHRCPCRRKESLNNAALRRGCEELGYPVIDIPRNAPQDHDCGWCCFGCRDGRKGAVSETWLVDMARSGNGVVLPGARALRILHRRQRSSKAKAAEGVLFEFQGTWSGAGKFCVVEADVTVVACGALGTPPLLKRSGLTNKHIGKNLHLHPVVMVWGYFPPEGKEPPMTECRSYEGGIMTAMSVVEDCSGYGAVIQTPSLHPGLFSVVTPWVDAADFKARMARFERTAHVFALSRDRGSGGVDASGSVWYKMHPHDEDVLRRGVERMLRIMAAAGAAEVGTTSFPGERAELGKMSARRWEEFVMKEAREKSKGGIRGLPVCSAHQMGSCRMGATPADGAVDGRGEAWEVEGLYVADASVLPTAIGVNPMVTVQAVAYCTGQSVLHHLKRKIKKMKSSGNTL